MFTQVTVMGNQAQAVSSPEALRTEAVVSGKGAPTHTPQRPAQIYCNVDNLGGTPSNYFYLWAAGVWTMIV